MKIANALSERADLQRRIEQLKNRMLANAKFQEGDEPAEDPMDLLAELNGCIARLEWLITSINHTNCSVTADGMSLTAMLARRDTMRTKLNAMRGLLENASARVTMYSPSEIRVCSSVNVPKLQKQVDALSHELRELDERLQELNWTTELQEAGR